MNADPQNRILLFEALDLLSDTAILGAFYGIAFTLYCLCTQSLYLKLRDPDKRRQTRLTFGYMTFVLFCATVYLILSIWISKMIYIDNADFSGGAIYYEEYPTPAKYRAAASVFDMILEVTTMAIQIWRLCIIWGGTRYAIAVTILPVLLLLSCIVLQTLVTIVGSLIPPDQLGISVASQMGMASAYYVIISVFTLFVTGLVATRLLLVRRNYIRIMGTLDDSSPYMGIIAMLIESYALDSAWSIASAISYTINSPSYYLFLEIDSTVKVVAYFLVVYRVASGRAWTRDTEHRLTSLQWNHDIQEADEVSGPHSRTPEVKGAR